MLSELDTAALVLGCVSHEDFADPDLAHVIRAVEHLATLDMQPSAVTVAWVLDRWNVLGLVGGEPYLVKLTWANNVMILCGTASLLAHAEIVHEWAEKRRAVAALGQQAKQIMGGATQPVRSRRGEMPS